MSAVPPINSLTPLLSSRSSLDQGLQGAHTPTRMNLDTPGSSVLRQGSLNVIEGTNSSCTPARHTATRSLNSILQQRRALPSFGHRFISFLDSTHWGIRMAVVDSLVSFLLALMYLVSSGYTGPVLSGQLMNDAADYPTLPKLLVITEFCLGFLLILFFIPRLLFLYPNHFQKSYLLRPETFLTLFTCIPIFVLRGPWIWSCKTIYVYDGLNASTSAPIDFFIFAWPIRFLRLWWSLHRGLSLLTSSPTIRLHLSISKIINLVCGIVCCLFTCAAFLHISEVRFAPPLKEGNNLTFFDAFFFTFLIAVTIAYDAGLVPDHPFPRVIIITTIILGISLVPYGISEVLAATSLQSKYDSKLVHDGKQDHIVVVGSGASLEPHTLRHFLSQFLSRSNQSGAVFKVAILAPHEPSTQLTQLLREPHYRHTVQWIRGSVMDLDDAVNRVFVKDAAACFVLSRKYAFASQSEDSANVLRTMALASTTSAPIYVQCLLPENRPHFSQFSDLVLCVDALKLAILARSVFCPGFSTLLYLMTMTSHRPATDTESMLYWNVITIEKCCAHISMSGRSEADVACHLYRDLGIIFLAKQEPEEDEVIGFDLVQPSRFMNGSEIMFVLTPHGGADRVSTYIIPSQFCVPKATKSNSVSSVSIRQREPSIVATGLREIDFPSFQDFPFSKTSPIGTQSQDRLAIQRFHTVDIASNALPIPSSRRNSYAIERNRGSLQTRYGHLPIKEKLPSLPETAFCHGAEPAISSPESSVYSQIDRELPCLFENAPILVSGEYQDHILLCAPPSNSSIPVFPSNLGCFLEGLSINPINVVNVRVLVVVLCEASPGQDEWEELQDSYGGPNSLIFVKGSPLNIRDLRRAGAQHAARVVVLSNETAVLSQSCGPLKENKADNIEDANTVMCLFLVKSICPSTAFVIVEFVHLQTMTFLTDRDVSAFNATPETCYNNLLPQISPSFLAGNVFNVSLLDSLIAQAYHAPHLIYIVRHLLRIGNPWTSAKFDITDNSDSTVPTVFQDAVPIQLVGQPIHVAFQWYMNEQQAMILGIYRLRDNFRNVMLSPLPTILIEAQDWLFLLG